MSWDGSTNELEIKTLREVTPLRSLLQSKLLTKHRLEIRSYTVRGYPITNSG